MWYLRLAATTELCASQTDRLESCFGSDSEFLIVEMATLVPYKFVTLCAWKVLLACMKNVALRTLFNLLSRGLFVYYCISGRSGGHTGGPNIAIRTSHCRTDGWPLSYSWPWVCLSWINWAGPEGGPGGAKNCTQGDESRLGGGCGMVW